MHGRDLMLLDNMIIFVSSCHPSGTEFLIDCFCINGFKPMPYVQNVRINKTKKLLYKTIYLYWRILTFRVPFANEGSYVFCCYSDINSLFSSFFQTMLERALSVNIDCNFHLHIQCYRHIVVSM